MSGWAAGKPLLVQPGLKLCRNSHSRCTFVWALGYLGRSHQTGRHAAAPRWSLTENTVPVLHAPSSQQPTGAPVIVPLLLGGNLRFREPKNLPSVTGLVRGRVGTKQQPIGFQRPLHWTRWDTACTPKHSWVACLSIPFTNIY